MTVWVLEGYDTGAHNYRGYDGVRHREYTSSRRTAELFEQVPRIDFTDSGHGIVFSATEHRGRRKPVRRYEHVREHMARLRKERRRPPTRHGWAHADDGSECAEPAWCHRDHVRTPERGR